MRVAVKETERQYKSAKGGVGGQRMLKDRPIKMWNKEKCFRENIRKGGEQ